MEAAREWVAFLVLEQGTRDPPQEVARRASWAMHFWGGGFFAFKLARGLQADAARAVVQHVISNV